MNNKSAIALIAAVILFGMIKTSFAVDVGNKICPVTGENIDEASKATYEYKGKVYNLCCNGCIAPFKKDPEKYVEKVEKELEAESAPSHGMHEGHHH